MVLLIPWLVCVCIFVIRGNSWTWAIVKGSVAFVVLALLVFGIVGYLLQLGIIT